MPFVLFLALLASATAAPTTKGRRANEQPKVRLVVTGETNVARTTRGARASNRVAQMAAWGGNVTMTIRAAHNTFTVVEVADPNEARLFKEQAERSGLRVEEDQRRYPGNAMGDRACVQRSGAERLLLPVGGDASALHHRLWLPAHTP